MSWTVREAVQLVKVDSYAHEHLQPRREGAARLLLEIGADDGVLLGPDRAACSSGHLPGALVLLDKLQIAVARIAIHAHLARLGPHPIRLGQGVAEGLLDVAVQLREREDAGRINGDEEISHACSNVLPRLRNVCRSSAGKRSMA